MSGSGTSLKTKASLIKNKENQSFVTYKSLNQRIYDQNMQLSKNPTNNMNTWAQQSSYIKKKTIKNTNFRTKQNSPTHKELSLERNLVGWDLTLSRILK